MSGLLTLRDLRIIGGIMFDERANALGSCCTTLMDNISTENTNNTATFTLLDTGGQRQYFYQLFMSNMIAADCSNGRSLIELNAGSMNVRQATIINASSCGSSGILRASSTGRFINTRIIGDATATGPPSQDSSGNPIPVLADSNTGEMAAVDVTRLDRLRTDWPKQLGGNLFGTALDFAFQKPPFAAAPAGAGANVTVAMDPGVGTCGQGGFLMKGDTATLGFDTAWTMTADQQLSLCFGNLPPTNFAVAGSITGGTLAAGTYYYNIMTCSTNPCPLNFGPAGSAPSPEVACTISSGATGSCAATWTVAIGPAVNSYYVCRGSSTGQNFAGVGTCYNVSPGSATSFTDTGGAATIGNVTMPVYNNSFAEYHRFTPTAYTSATVHSVKRLKTNQGTPIANGNITLSAGWGSTAAVSAAAGFDQAFTFTVTANGTGIAANPTFTFTFNDGTWTNIPLFICKQVGGTGILTTLSGEQTGTAMVLGPVTFNGTPATGSTYVINCVGFGK